MRVRLTRNLVHRLLGVARLDIDDESIGWFNLSEARYLETSLQDPWALSVFLASREL